MYNTDQQLKSTSVKLDSHFYVFGLKYTKH